MVHSSKQGKLIRVLRNYFSMKVQTVTIVGLGYVGLPLACLCAKKYRVNGLELRADVVKKINSGKSHIKDDFLEREVAALKGRINATADASVIKKSDVVIVCVPTPVTEAHLPDLEPLKKSCETISKHMKTGQLIVIESTIYPGTMAEIVQPILAKSGLKCEKDFFLVHCPERIDPGNKKWTIENIPRVLGGLSREGAKIGKEFYESVLSSDVSVLSSAKEAEAVKVVENTFRDVNIAFVNELAKSFDVMGIDIREVIRGASTKPFGYTPFYPGPGVGGHCFDGNEFIFAKISGKFGVYKLKNFYDLVGKHFKSQIIEKTKLIPTKNIEVLSFDLNRNESCFMPVTFASKRSYGQSIKISAAGNYSITVTDKHPMLVADEKLDFAVKFADELNINDKLALNSKLPILNIKKHLDLVGLLPKKGKIRVKPINGTFYSLKDSINSHLLKMGLSPRDVFKNNSMPLNQYLELERLGMLPFSREQLWLCTGRGPSFSKIKAVISINEEFCRLIGYYLGEGCITKEKSLRTRFTFNANEKEYLSDVIAIVENLGLKHSLHKSKDCEAITIRVSSPLFSMLLNNVLKCGKNCYGMSIPPELLFSSNENKLALLSGLLRGEGGVSVYSGKRPYIKKGKSFSHENNSVAISFFSSSSELFQQTLLLLLDSGFVPMLAKRKNYLVLHGEENAVKSLNLFDGAKKQKIASYLKNKIRSISAKQLQVFNSFILLPVKKIESVKTNEVYSVEVEGTNTLITSNSIIAHNCIAVDPYYLIEKAKSKGFEHRFLSLAREINNSMPSYAVALSEKLLAALGKDLKN